MTTGPRIRVIDDDDVVQIVLSRPRANQFDPGFLEELLAAIPDGAGAVVVSSDVPGIFAAGGDVAWMAEADLQEQTAFVALCQQVNQAFETLDCPTIAAVDGFCLGGGLELALACDLRIVGTSARLGLPETTLGLIAGAGGIQRLVRAIGQGVARDLLLTGRQITGAEAGGLGIASRVVADGTATTEALSIARSLSNGPREAIAATKRLAVAASELRMEEGLALERREWEEVRRSPCTQEGLAAFAEKRSPNFRRASLR